MRCTDGRTDAYVRDPVERRHRRPVDDARVVTLRYVTLGYDFSFACRAARRGAARRCGRPASFDALTRGPVPGAPCHAAAAALAVAAALSACRARRITIDHR